MRLPAKLESDWSKTNGDIVPHMHSRGILQTIVWWWGEGAGSWGGGGGGPPPPPPPPPPTTTTTTVQTFVTFRGFLKQFIRSVWPL